MVELVGRIERRMYGARSQAELEALEDELTPMGWIVVGRQRCPPGCTCGGGPFWTSFVLELPLSKKELN